MFIICPATALRFTISPVGGHQQFAPGNDIAQNTVAYGSDNQPGGTIETRSVSFLRPTSSSGKVAGQYPHMIDVLISRGIYER